MSEPIRSSVDEARSRVFEALKDKKCETILRDKFITKFNELRDKVDTCNNVARLQNIKVEADALKIRCLNEIEAEEKKLSPSPTPMDDDKPDAPAAPVKKHKNVSIKSINAETSWVIETPDDVEKYVSSLKKQLMDSLEENTIIRIEF